MYAELCFGSIVAAITGSTKDSDNDRMWIERGFDDYKNYE